jgi:hypothetical protein
LSPRAVAARRLIGGALAGATLILLLAAGCSSRSGSGSSATTSTTLDPTLVDSSQRAIPWLAFGALAAVLVVALRSRSQRAGWWARADALLRDGRSVVRWSSAPRAFANEINALSTDGVPGQLQYADAESAQRLAIVRATLDQFDQLIAPHRKTS